MDVFDLLPSKYLTQHEIDAAKEVQVKELNVQNQDKFIFPQTFTVAQAYLDQLTRDNALPSKQLSELNDAITKAEVNPKAQGKLKDLAKDLDKEAAKAKPNEAARMTALAKILRAPQLIASTPVAHLPSGE